MRLSALHEDDNLPHQHKVWQQDEHVGANTKPKWYQKYHKQNKGYKWPRHTWAGATGYDQQIMKDGHG